jgi:hypothetical protein
MSGRLLLIELRRSGGLWLLLALPLFFWLHRDLPQIAPFWFETSLTVRDGVTIVGPALAGVAAWLAGREARRATGELLRTTAHPAFARRITSWAGVSLCGIAVYCLIGLAIVAFSWSRASWGGPIFGPMLVGLVAVPAYAALGFAVGRRLPSRFTAPLVVIALLFLQIFVGEQRAWYAFLSPVVSVNGSVWWGIQPDLAAQQSAFLLGIGGLALASVAFQPRSSGRYRFATALCGLLVAGSVGAVWYDAPGGRFLFSDPHYRAQSVIPYEPVCTDTPLPVCVHPAYRASLDDTAATLNNLAAPILGLPGVPTRAEQGYPGLRADPTGETLWFSLFGRPEYLPLSVVPRLMHDPNSWQPVEAAKHCPNSDPQMCEAARAVLGRWLLRQAGVADEQIGGAFPNTPAVGAAVARFAALDPQTQHTWLVAHFADLRAGRVPLEELP